MALKKITPFEAVPPSVGNYTRRQHLVPRWYLHRFADEQNKIIKVSTDRALIETVTPNGAGWKPHAYSVRGLDGKRDDRVEKFIGIIENDAKMAVDVLVHEGFPLGEDHKAALGAFMAIQMFRGEYYKRWLHGVFEMALEGIATAGRTWPRDEDAGPDDFLVLNPDNPEVPRLATRVVVDLMLGAYQDFAPTLFQRCWTLQRFPEPLLFTGHQPTTPWGPSLAKSEPVALKEAAELRTPLDRSTALVLGPPGSGAHAPDQVILMPDSTRAHLGNFKMGDWCEEWLFDHPDGPLEGGLDVYAHKAGPLVPGIGGGRFRPVTIGRNAPCPCGSGRKFKRCHGA